MRGVILRSADAVHVDKKLPLNRVAEEIIRICGETLKAAAGVRP